jgi:gamma-glutamylcyclotransferase (GGCT)/AIG2-like uncharacterized protein YtfP
MNKLFIYGTLIDPEIQKSILGRIINGIPNILEGYEKSEIEIEGEKYPLTVQNKNEIVEGLVIDINDDELKKIDEYEGVEYKRIEIVLQSGISAWVYLKT